MLLIDWFNRVWKKPPNELERALTVEERVEKHIRAQVEELERSRDRFEALLADRAYMLGDEFGVVDSPSFVPQVRRDRRSERHGAVPPDVVEHLALDRAYGARGMEPERRRAPAGK